MPDWSRFCRIKQFVVEEPHVYVLFPSGRKQRVRVHEEDDVFRLVSTALGRAAVEQLIRQGGPEAEEQLALRIMQRNRSAPLVGFRMTTKGKVVVESVVPRLLGLHRDEFRLHLVSVAREADWLERLLTGVDRN